MRKIRTGWKQPQIPRVLQSYENKNSRARLSLWLFGTFVKAHSVHCISFPRNSTTSDGVEHEDEEAGRLSRASCATCWRCDLCDVGCAMFFSFPAKCSLCQAEHYAKNACTQNSIRNLVFIFVLRIEQKTANVNVAVWGSEWMYSQQGSLRLALVFCVVVTFVSAVRLPFSQCWGMRQTHLHVVTAGEKYSELNDSKWKRQTIIDCKCIIRVGEMGQSKAKCFVSWWDYTEINFRNGFNEIVKYKSRHCLLPTAACHIADESIFIPASQLRGCLRSIHWWKDSFITTTVCTNCYWLRL